MGHLGFLDVIMLCVALSKQNDMKLVSFDAKLAICNSRSEDLALLPICQNHVSYTFARNAHCSTSCYSKAQHVETGSSG